MAQPIHVNGSTVTENRKARHNYTIDSDIEAGIMLVGTEVKSLRNGHANLSDAFAAEQQGELWLLNCHIGEYAPAQRFNHLPLRPRKILLHKRQIEKLLAQLKTKGITLIPLSLYFNERGKAKIKLGLAHGKKKYEKRDTIKDRDWKRDQERLMKNR